MKIRISSSVSNFKDKILKNWPVEEYQYPQDINKPVCFFGMYHGGDYTAFKKHKGEKMIFWCGSDILNLKDGSIFLKYKNICENKVEQEKLSDFGIVAGIYPTFAGDIRKYPYSMKTDGEVNIWLCMHEGREEEYGLKTVKEMAKMMDYKFHIYGISGKNEENIIYHGQVSEAQLDKEIRNYQIACRLNSFEGFSEVVAKGILFGQIIESRIPYERMNDREYWREKLTNFNWLKI